MKRNALFILILGFLFFVMYWINLSEPPKFIWKPTYDTNDKQPYGCYVLDEILSISWEKGYMHSYESISELEDSVGGENGAILIVCNYFRAPEYSVKDLFEYIERGGTLFIAADNFHSDLTDSLGLGYNYDFASSIGVPFSQATKTVSFSNSVSGDSIFVPKSMLLRSFTWGLKDKALAFDVHSLATNSEEESFLLHYRLGNGDLYLCYTPLLFTNFAVLNDSINPFIRQALAPLQNKPLIRTEYYGKGRVVDGTSGSFFRYLLSQPSLKWAYYIVLILVLLFMIFTAKRKQKPIPVVTPPINKMLEFVRSITTLYLRRNDNADIIMKKYIYWSDEIKRKYGINVINEHHDKAFIKRFSAKTDMSESDARYLFLELDGIREHTDVSDKEMMDLIMKMKID